MSIKKTTELHASIFVLRQAKLGKRKEGARMKIEIKSGKGSVEFAPIALIESLETV